MRKRKTKHATELHEKKPSETMSQNAGSRSWNQIVRSNGYSVYRQNATRL